MVTFEIKRELARFKFSSKSFLIILIRWESLREFSFWPDLDDGNISIGNLYILIGRQFYTKLRQIGMFVN